MSNLDLSTVSQRVQEQPLILSGLDNSLPPNTIKFFATSGEVARISSDGIMRFAIEANDENAAKFIQCIESFIQKRLTGLEVDTKTI